MDICDFEDRLEMIGGELVRIVNAESRKNPSKSLDVYREHENGETECRNLYYSMYGYRVGFPGDVNSLYGRSGIGAFVEGLEEYGECHKICSFLSRKINDVERRAICMKYPEFKYVLNKWSGSIASTLDALRIWKDHREIELVLAAGFEKVALNKAFWRLTEKKRRELACFMRKNPRCKGWSLVDIQAVNKHGYNVVSYSRYRGFRNRYRKISYELYRYLMRIGMADLSGIQLYRDYHNLLVQTRHDSEDAYWKFPKDLQGKHDELRDEVARIQALRDAEKLREKQSAYVKAVRKMLRYDMEISGYRVFVPDSVSEIKRQADALHQCLIAADYVSQVIKKKCVLVFIQKDGEPVATCQLLKNDKIGQFYADELDRNNCLPSDEVRAVMNKWIEMKECA